VPVYHNTRLYIPEDGTFRSFGLFANSAYQPRPARLSKSVSSLESAGSPLDVFGLNSILGISLKSVGKKFKFV